MAVARCSICILSVYVYGEGEAKRSEREGWNNESGPVREWEWASSRPSPYFMSSAAALPRPRCYQQQQQQMWTATRWICLLFGCAKAELPVFAKQRDCRWTWASNHELSASIEIDTAAGISHKGTPDVHQVGYSEVKCSTEACR